MEVPMNYADVHEINMYLEGNNFAFKIWKQSYEAFNNYFSNFKNYIIVIILFQLKKEDYHYWKAV